MKDNKKNNGHSLLACPKKSEKTSRLEKVLKNKLQIALAIVSVCVLSFGIIVSLFALNNSEKLKVNNSTQNIGFKGEYSINGSVEFLPLTEDVEIDAKNLNTVIFKGNFSKKVSAPQQIIFRSVNIIFSVCVNGEKVYSFGEEGEDMQPTFFSKSPGNCWAVWDCGEILPTDNITITLQNVYTAIYRNQFNTFYNNIYAGSAGELYQIMYDNNFFSYVFGAGLVFLGIALLVIAIALFCFERKITLRYLWLSFAAFIAGIWCYIDFDYVTLFLPFPILINIIDILSLSLMLVFMLLYVKSYLKMKITNIFLAVCTFALNAFIAVGIILQLCGVCDLQELIGLLTVLLVLSGTCMQGVAIYETVKLKSKDTLMLAINISPMFLCGIVQSIFSSFTLNQKSSILRVGILLFCIFAFVILLLKIHKTIKKLEQSCQTEITLSQKENELLESKILLMLGQIQPHFLFNSLTAVGQLCAVNPPLAEKAIHNFADYLRGNIDAIGQNNLIPFAREIEHVKVYLELEKMRFDDRVSAEFDLQVSDFMIPTLTLQTIVENAVTHGITKKKKGGLVRIVTRENASSIIISVIDDGVGFDVDEKNADEKTHYGLKNVSMRVASTCQGTLDIKSELGIGTEVVIILPKKIITEK